MKKYLSLLTIIGFILSILFLMPKSSNAQKSFSVGSGAASGFMKSRSTNLGAFSTGDKDVKGFGAFGGGNRAFASKGSKKGARGAVDGAPDVSDNGSSKGNTFTTTVQAETAIVGQTYDGAYSIFKGYMSFDTTALPYDAIVTSATLTLYGKDKNVDNNTQFNIGVYESEWTEPLWNTEWGSISGSEHGAISSEDFNAGQANVINIIRPYDIVKPGEVTAITLVSSNTTAENDIIGNEYIEYYTSDAEDKNLRPQLDIEYIGDDPTITASLSFTGETIAALNPDEPADFKLEAVYPTVISEGTNNLTFRVRYVYPVDSAAAAPSTAQLWIDLNYDSVDANKDGIISWNEADFDDPGEKIDMQKADPAADDWTNGVIYVAEVEAKGDGTNSLVYQFNFEDSSDSKETAAGGNASDTMQIEPIQSDNNSDSNTCFINSL